MIESVIIGCLLVLWGITALFLIFKLLDGMKDPDNKWWESVGIGKKNSLLTTFWVFFIVLGVFGGLVGMGILGASLENSFTSIDWSTPFSMFFDLFFACLPLIILLIFIGWLMYRFPPPMIDYRRI